MLNPSKNFGIVYGKFVNLDDVMCFIIPLKFNGLGSMVIPNSNPHNLVEALDAFFMFRFSLLI